MSGERNRKRGSASLVDLLRHCWPEIRRHRGRILVALIALFAETGLRLLEPWPVKVVFDRVLGDVGTGSGPLGWLPEMSPQHLVALAAGALVVIVGLRALAAYGNTIGFALVGTRVLAAVRSRVFHHLHLLPLSFHTRARSGDLVVRVISDVGMLQEVTVTALLPLVARMLILVGIVGVMFWMNWQLALLAMALLPLFWLRTIRLGRKLREVAQEQRRREGAMAATAAESLSGMKIVQALAAAEAFTGSFRRQNEGSLREGVKGKRLAARLERSVDLLVAASSALVLWQGARLVLAGAISPGDLLVFLAYLKSAFRPVQDFAKFTGRLSKAGAAGARVIELLDEPPAVVDRADAIDVPSLRGDIRFDQVEFAYDPGCLILDRFSLHVRAGQTVAVLGPSGTGKSTLLSLLVRLHECSAGTIRIDGRELREFRVESLRRQFGVVLQENVLFAATVRENIALGLPDATAEAVETAARLANAHGFISGLPQGYETRIGERGATLSHGQRQRIAIARAAIRGASVLLYDEPTTGLDAESEQQVIKGLHNLSRGRTTLWVTHDVRQAHFADVVVVMERGQVVECGAPEELRAGGGRFERLSRAFPAGKEVPDVVVR